MNTFWKIGIRLIGGLAIGALGLVLLAKTYPAAAIASRYAATGRMADPCTRVDAVAGVDKHVGYRFGAVELLKASSLVRKQGGLELWRVSGHGEYWVPSGNVEAFTAMLSQQVHGMYGPISPGSVVLDCGAHIGLSVREALRQGASKVVAIEPSPENIECLRRNFAHEIADGSVIVYPKGVWNKEEILRFHTVEGNSGGDSITIDNGPGSDITVPVTTIDNVVSDLKLERVDFLKVDIKGSERQALRGAVETLKRWKPRVTIASEHLPDDNVQIPAIIREIRPDYTVECGSCYLEYGEIRPEVLFFR